MSKRRVPLVEQEVYHILSKTIAGFEVFRNGHEYERMRSLFKYYQIKNPPLRFAIFQDIKNKDKFLQKHFAKRERLVEIVAYCIMPTHIHLALKQLKERGISTFIGNILNSYSRYFNIKTKRRGPLWESRFKNVHVSTEEQMIHLTRYIHLNPVTAYLINKPQGWKFSSYKEFLGKIDEQERICNYSELLDIEPKSYRRFVNSQIDYQRELARLKRLFIE